MNDNTLTETITVPFCWLPGSLGQTFDPITCKRSRFQVESLVAIAKNPMFAYFLTATGPNRQVIIEPGSESACIVAWFDLSGFHHITDLGIDRVLDGEDPRNPTIRSGDTMHPVPLSSLTYYYRMPDGWEPVNLSLAPEALLKAKEGDAVMLDHQTFIVQTRYKNTLLETTTDEIFLTTANTLRRFPVDDDRSHTKDGSWYYPWIHVRSNEPGIPGFRGSATATRAEMADMIRNGGYRIG